MRTVACSILLIISSNVWSFNADDKLDLVIKTFQLKPKECESSKLNPQEIQRIKTGKILFESKSLSGDRDISCKNCHLEKFNLTDGLPLAVGVGGEGEGVDRYRNNDGALVQRNAISLRGRGSDDFNAFFWDGKVHEVDGIMYSQFGESVQNKFKRPLALAAILPLVERDEFIGKVNYLSLNDVQAKVKNQLYMKRYYAVSEAIRNRALKPNNDDDKALQSALVGAGIDINTLELSDIGNLLAEFIAQEFHCIASKWDEYLKGNKDILSPSQKNGAILFYGKGRCVSCHSGPMMSDFKFHSIGAPQGGFGPHSRGRDIGRAGVTNQYDDLYKFRTPPLIEVAKNAPYGHNGAFRTLEEIITHHSNPIEFYKHNESYYEADKYELGKLIGSRDQILLTIDIGKENEIKELMEFLDAL